MCFCLLLNNQCPEASQQRREKNRKMNLLSCNWASSICCYGSGKVTRSPCQPCSPPQCCYCPCAQRMGGVCNTRWSNTLRFMDNALSQTVSEYINCPFLVIEVLHFTPEKQPGKILFLSLVWRGSAWVFWPGFICWVLFALIYDIFDIYRIIVVYSGGNLSAQYTTTQDWFGLMWVEPVFSICFILCLLSVKGTVASNQWLISFLTWSQDNMLTFIYHFAMFAVFSSPPGLMNITAPCLTLQ